jgi:PadR family transcriptional regulator PadR
LPLEAAILGVEGRFHGFGLAKELAERSEARKLTAHGTLYKALGRLEDAGLLRSAWEDADVAVAEGRPRRRLYEVTGAGERALAAWRAQQARLRSPSRLGATAGRAASPKTRGLIGSGPAWRETW